MDETGLQLNNKPGKVVAARGARDVHTITLKEKGETISVVVCCNAEGNFIPPYCIFKGINKKSEFEDGMPPGSKVVMSPKTAYINSGIFFDWLKTHFLPRKPPGKVLLIIDGHASHLNNPETLTFALSNDIEFLCLPNHCTHYLQPLDRAVFKSLKLFFYQAASNWMKTKDRPAISRLSFGALLNESWIQSATVRNAISAFKATGIYPFCPSAIPDHAFILPASEHELEQKIISENSPEEIAQQESNTPGAPVHFCPSQSGIEAAGPSTGRIKENLVSDLTPTKILNNISPVPNLPEKKRKRAKQVACHATSKEFITIKQEKAKEKAEKEKKKASLIEMKKSKCKHGSVKEGKKMLRPTKPRKARKQLFDKEQLESDADEDLDSICLVCVSSKSKSEEEWVQCQECKRWAHTRCAKNPKRYYICLNCDSDFNEDEL